MALNIKNHEAHKLASELAEITGMSMTAAVIDALRNQLALYKQGSQAEKYLAEELMLIGKRCAAHLRGPAKSTAHGDLLYDEMGMPR